MPFKLESHLEQLVDLRHRLHASAEVSGSEEQTAEIIADFLEGTSPDALHTGVGGHGVMATYKGTSSTASHIMLRCELDALPITDANDVEYKSQTEGTGHKCGHDGHMSIICGVARLFQEQKPDHDVTLLFQPAEETGEGAKRILADEKFKRLKPDFCFALHNLPGYTKHQIIVRDHVFAAASVGLTLKFKGETSHAAHPEEGASPAMAVSHLIQSLSAVPQCSTSMNKAAKVTVVHTEMGELAFGISPGAATVSATLRAYENKTLKLLQKECVGLARGLAKMYSLKMSHTWVESFSSTVNDADATAVIRSAAGKLDLEIMDKNDPFEWSEDFGHFTQQTRGALFGLGIGENHPPLHAESYDFPDDVISTGVSMFMQIIEEVKNIDEK